MFCTLGDKGGIEGAFFTWSSWYFVESLLLHEYNLFLCLCKSNRYIIYSPYKYIVRFLILMLPAGCFKFHEIRSRLIYISHLYVSLHLWLKCYRRHMFYATSIIFGGQCYITWTQFALWFLKICPEWDIFHT